MIRRTLWLNTGTSSLVVIREDCLNSRKVDVSMIRPLPDTRVPGRLNSAD
jgi:hypothetical protein